MDKNKDYSLNVDGIDDSVSSFVSKDATLKLSVQKPDTTKAIYKITKGRATGVINVYVKKSGLVSVTIQGAGSLSAICEQCCDCFIQQTAIPNSLRKSFSLRQIQDQNIDYFKEELTGSHKLTILAKPANGNAYISEYFYVINCNGVKVTCTIFTSKTFLLQGNVTPLYVTVMTEALNWLVDVSRLSSVADSISLNNTTHVIQDEINQLIPCLSACGDTDGVIERMVLTSVSLFNSGVMVEDYGCYTFGILKALEGVLKLRLSEDFPDMDKLGDYYSYDNVSRRQRIDTTIYDGNIELKKALNKGYNCWV